MSSRIIRGDNRLKKLNVSSPAEGTIIGGSEEHVMDVEKQAFEQGYAEGERIGNIYFIRHGRIDAVYSHLDREQPPLRIES